MVERVLVDTSSGEHGHSHGQKVIAIDNSNVESNGNKLENQKKLNSEERKSELNQVNDTSLDVKKEASVRRRSSITKFIQYITIKYELSTNTRKSLSSVILSIVLTIHSVFEGMVIGLQKSPTSVLIISAAITGHKVFEATALGANFVKKEVSKKKAAMWVIVFALGTPVGLLTGLLLSNTTDIVAGCLNALSVGTFLYITLTEIIPDEFDGTNRWQKFIAYLLGLSIMPVATIWQDVWHQH